jgi:hypothetical protein
MNIVASQKKKLPRMVPIPQGTLLGHIAQVLGGGLGSIPDPNARPDVMLNAVPGAEPTFGNPTLMEPKDPTPAYMSGLMSDENQAYGESERLEREAYSDPLPQRRSLRPGQAGMAGIAAVIAHLLGDREQTFMKGALSTIETQENQKLEQQMANLQRKSQEKIMLARQQAQRAERARAERQNQMAQQAKMQELQAEKQKFETENATKLKIAEMANQGKLSAQQFKLLMQLPAEARPGFARSQLGITDTDVLGVLDNPTVKDQVGVSQAGLNQARAGLAGAQAGLATEKSITERVLRPDRQKEIQAKAGMYQSISGLRKEQALNVAAATDLMGPEFALKAALGEASIAKLKAETANMPAELRHKWFTANTDRLKLESDQILQGIKGYDDGISELVQRYTDAEKQLTQLTLDEEEDSDQAKALKSSLEAIDQAIKASKARRKALAEEAVTLKKKLQGQPAGSGGGGYEYRRNPKTGAIERVPKTEAGGPKAQEMTRLGKKFTSTFPGTRVEQYGPGSIPDSTHKKGEGLDLRGPDLQQYADWAIKVPGVRNVIYNRRIWSPGKGWRSYTGPHPHHDHVHID